MSAIVFIAWLVVLGLGIWVGNTKHRPVLGGVLTFFFSLIGLLIIALIPRKNV
jgi:hypothetical protein